LNFGVVNVLVGTRPSFSGRCSGPHWSACDVIFSLCCQNLKSAKKRCVYKIEIMPGEVKRTLT
jgi:hypothetical protein